MTNLTALYQRIGATVFNNIINTFYNQILDDYRIGRFFNSGNEAEQKQALTKVIEGFFNGKSVNDEAFVELLNEFFTAAFVRSKRKSFVAGSDFGFFGYVIEQDRPSTNYLCDAHKALLKFMPTDFHYDAVLEQLATVLQTVNLDSSDKNELLNLAEQARNAVLGK